MMPGGISFTQVGGRFEVPGLEETAYRLFVFTKAADGIGMRGAVGRVPRAIVDSVHPSATELEIRIDAAGMASGWLEGSLAFPTGFRADASLSVYAKVLRGGVFAVPQERLDAGVTTFRLGPLPAGEYDLICEIEGRGPLTQRGIQLAPNATLQLPPFAFDSKRPMPLRLPHAG